MENQGKEIKELKKQVATMTQPRILATDNKPSKSKPLSANNTGSSAKKQAIIAPKAQEVTSIDDSALTAGAIAPKKKAVKKADNAKLSMSAGELKDNAAEPVQEGIADDVSLLQDANIGAQNVSVAAEIPADNAAELQIDVKAKDDDKVMSHNEWIEVKGTEDTGKVSGRHKKAAKGASAAVYHRTAYPKGEVVLELDKLTKRYGERVSVNDVSLKVYSGEVFGFLGPNGAGKTTTIRMIAGLHTITSGSVKICGTDIREDFNAAVSKIGGIIENPEMYKYMSGWDNLKYYASLYDNIGESQIMDVVKLVRMQNRIHEKVKRYSLGMRQRVGIAQSLLHNPRLLILDEPTNGLDPAGIHEMRDFLKMLAHEYGIAVFISSHILTEMQLMCDRVGIVNLGKLVAVKTMEEWVSSEGDGVKAKLVTTDRERAENLLRKLGVEDISANGELLIFNTFKSKLKELTVAMGVDGIGILSLSQGEKSLEETFLELTASGGTEVF